VTGAHSLYDALSLILQEALKVLCQVSGTIALFNSKTLSATVQVSSQGFPENLFENTNKGKDGMELFDNVLRQESPTIISDIKNNPLGYETQKLLDAGIQSLIAVPFSPERHISGIFCIGAPGQQEWTAREIDFLTLFSAYAAFAIQKFAPKKDDDDAPQVYTPATDILNYSHDIIITVDSMLHIISLNETAEKTLGYSLAELREKSPDMLWPRLEDWQQVLILANQEDKLRHYETQMKTKKEKILDVILTIIPSRNTYGETIGFTIIAYDMTEQKNMGRIVEEQAQSLQRQTMHRDNETLAAAPVAIHTSDPVTPVKDQTEFVNILCIDQDLGTLNRLTSILEPGGYHISSAKTGHDGLEMAVASPPDAIILELSIGDMDGFELSQKLKNHPRTKHVPLIVFTEKDISVEDRMKLIWKIESILKKSYAADDDILKHIQNLSMTYPYRMGLTDSITGLFDRSYFQIRLAQEICLADRHKTLFSILLVELSNFQEYVQKNDMDYGNTCLRKMADFLLKTTRGYDSLARYGNNSFAMLLINTAEEGARSVAQRLLAFAESYRFAGVENLKDGKMLASIAAMDYDLIGPSTPEEMMFKAHELIRGINLSMSSGIKFYGHGS
ncbi:MAG: diguanylate cyclase, partial [Syntrophobacterales bacterium]|nr:diguanylate cyclase [Syntrophobacterales bacterium]